MPSPISVPMRNYVISRKGGADAEDPTSLEFWPAKGSDELYEALKEAFPAYKTHKDRMREAVMEFYLQEREEEAVLACSMSNTSAATSFATMPETAMPSPAYFLQQQNSAGSMQTTPDYLPSPESQFTNTFPSTPAVESGNEQVSAIPNSMSVPGLREMTNVWSVSSTSRPKLRTRRAMTEAEKKEYRRKRIDGACSDCRRRRRKCDHESSESDSSSKGVKKMRKTLKATKTVHHMVSVAQPHFLEQSSTGTSPSLANTSPSQQTMMDLPSSILWPEGDGLELPDLGVDVDLFNSPAMEDPFADFVDFNQSSLDDAGFVPQLGLTDIWPSRGFSSQSQSLSSSGMIMPLPSYYAHTAAPTDQLSSGGTVNSPMWPANMLLAQQEVSDDLVTLHTTEKAVERKQSSAERVKLRENSIDGQPIPPRLPQPERASDGGFAALRSELTGHPQPDGMTNARHLDQLVTHARPEVSSPNDQSHARSAAEHQPATSGLASSTLLARSGHGQKRSGELYTAYSEDYSADISSSSSSSSPVDTTGRSSAGFADVIQVALPKYERRTREINHEDRIAPATKSPVPPAGDTKRISMSSDFAPGQIVRIAPANPYNTSFDTSPRDDTSNPPLLASRSDANRVSPSSGRSPTVSPHESTQGSTHLSTLQTRPGLSEQWFGSLVATLPLMEDLVDHGHKLDEPSGPRHCWKCWGEWFHKQRKEQRKGVSASTGQDNVSASSAMVPLDGQRPIVPAWHSRDSPWMFDTTTQRADSTHSKWGHTMLKPGRNGVNSSTVDPGALEFLATRARPTPPPALLHSAVIAVLVAFVGIVALLGGTYPLSGFTATSLCLAAVRSFDLASTIVASPRGKLDGRKTAFLRSLAYPLLSA